MKLKFIYLAFLFSFFENNAMAVPLDLSDSSIPVAKHVKKKSEFKFNPYMTLGEIPEAKEYSGKKVPVIADEFNSFYNKLPNGAGTYDVKPACEKSQIRRKEILVDSEELDLFDMVFYDYNDKAQQAKADKWPRPTVPYLEGDLFNPYREGDIRQEFGRFFNIQCLPTRLHYIYENGVRYQEFREGEKAWELEIPK